MLLPKVLSTTLLSLSLTVSTAAFGATIDDTVVIAPTEDIEITEMNRSPHKYTNLIEMLFPVLQPPETTPPTPPVDPSPPEMIPYADGHFQDQDHQPFSVNGILLVNKTHLLDESYRPFPDVGDGPTTYLLPDAQAAYETMQRDAQIQGFSFYNCSGYRSYAYQNMLFNAYAATVGVEQASLFSAQSGQSEHQTGLAMDVCSPADPNTTLQPGFGHTPAGRWLADNSWRYGFILRYPQGKEAITGYQFEPWHFRYVGLAAAAEIGPNPTQTLEEYLGVHPDPDHKRTMAVPNNALVLVDNTPVNLLSYNIQDFTYYRLRDLAVVLKDSNASFDIEWNAEVKRIDINPHSPYAETAPADVQGQSGNRIAIHSQDALQVAGKTPQVKAYKIDGNNFYKLRDLAPLLGFQVEWNEEMQLIHIKTEAPQPETNPMPSETEEPAPLDEEPPVTNPALVQPPDSYSPS